MELTWYGTACVVLREGEETIAFDPFCGVAPGQLKHPPEHLPDEAALRAAGHIFITHGHFDHISHLPRLYRDSQSAVYCTCTPAQTLLRRGLPQARLRIIEPGWSGRVGPFFIQALQGRHCKFDGPLVRKTVLSRRFFRHPGHLLRLLATHLSCPEKGETLFYQVTCGALRVQIMGSMGLDVDTVYPTGADVLILPLQGRSDQDTYALELARRLQPKSIILDHFDDSYPPITGEVEPSGLVENVRRELGISCRVPSRGETISLQKAEESIS